MTVFVVLMASSAAVADFKGEKDVIEILINQSACSPVFENRLGLTC